MKESIKKKFDSIDQSKIKVESTKELLAKIEKALNGKIEENADKAEALLDKFIAQAKAKNADIFVSKKAERTLTPTEKKKATQVVKSKLDSLMDTIANDPLLKDFNNSRRSKGGGKSDPLIDSERKAIQSGPRVSKKGWKNQYGKSTGGRKYYEYRENRIDRKAPNYGSRPWLKEGGFIHPSDANADKYVVVEIKADGSRREHNNFGDLETARMFASLKREFLPKGSQLMIEDKNGKNLYRSFKSGGEMTEQDYSTGFDYGEVGLDAEDFAKISDNINKEYLAKDRKSGVHDKFTKYWYNGGREKAIAKYGEDERKAWEEAYEDFKEDFYKMAKGGQVDESTAMVLSQNKAIAHHTEELKKAIAKNKKVEPWVVAKIERASTDISDVTHYLDGKTEYSKGGKIDNQYEGRSDSDIWNSWTKEQKYHFLDDHNDEFPQIERGEKQMLKNVEYNDIKIERIYDSLKRHIRQGQYANGGEVEFSANRKADNQNITNEELRKDYNDAKFNLSEFRSGNLKPSKVIGGGYKSSSVAKQLAEEYLEKQVAIYKTALMKRGVMEDGGKIRWQDVYVGDNALVIAENKMGMVVKPYGRRFHLKFPDGSEKTYSAEELEFFKDEEYAKGGNISGYKLKDIKGRLIEEGDMVKTKQTDGGLMSASEGEVGIVEKTKDAFNNDALLIRFRKTGKNYDTTILLNGKINEIVEKGKNSKSATTPTGKYVNKRNVLNLVVKNPNKNGTEKYLSINPKDFLDGLHEYAKGGKLTDDYTYIKRREVEHVIYRDSNGKEQLDFKPKNGFWVSKKALVDAGMNETKAKFDAKEVANELIALSSKAWDTLSIGSGSEIYASNDLQENLADEYRKVGIDKIYGQLTQPERKKVSEVLTDENEHSLRNYLALRGYNGEAEFKNYAKMYDDSFAKFGYRSNWNPKNVDLKLGSFVESRGKGDYKVEVNQYIPYGSNKGVSYYYVVDENKNTINKKTGKVYRGKQMDFYKFSTKEEAEKYAQSLNNKFAKGGSISDGSKLPEDMSRYFIKTSKTRVVEMSDLKPLRARPTGIENAEKYMRMAYEGTMDKRKPITIYKSQGKYRVYDGNSTYAVAKANGWEKIWAEIVKNPNMNTYEKRGNDLFIRAKKIRKEGEAWKDAIQRAKAMK